MSAPIYILIDGVLGKLGELHVCGVGNSQSASLTGFLGGNQDGAVGCVRTIKCGSVGSFQNNDVFDVIGVNTVSRVTIVDFTTGHIINNRYTVDYIKWLVVTGNGVGTTDTYGG